MFKKREKTPKISFTSSKSSRKQTFFNCQPRVNVEFNDGLVQPIANWTKDTQPAWNAGLGGRREKVLPVAGPVRGHSSRKHGPRNLTTIVPFSAPPDLEITILPTARVLYPSRSLSLAFSISRVFHFSPTLPVSTLLAPSLPHRETSVVTISPGKGSDILSNASGSGTRYRMRWI